MKKADLWIYRISTGLISGIMLMSALGYFATHDEVSKNFAQYGFPSFIIYPLGIAKILGLTAIWTRKSETLKEWAYAGFVFNILLAIGGHLYAGDSLIVIAVAALVMIFISYIFQKRVYDAKVAQSV